MNRSSEELDHVNQSRRAYFWYRQSTPPPGSLLAAVPVQWRPDMTAPMMSMETEPKKRRVRRCPACGQRLAPADESRCPLCDFSIGRKGVTGDDVTPFAAAYSQGRSGGRDMCEWVWFAGTERLKHLALMRSSAASRRFAKNNLLLLALSLGALQGTQTGWRWVTASAAIEPSGSTTPKGYYWLHAAAAPRPLPMDRAAEIPVDLWWNWVQAVLAVVLGMPAALLLMMFLLALMVRGVVKVHPPPYRAERRLTAALQYGTAWCVPLAVACWVLALRPVALVGGMSKWGWYPPERGFTLSAAVVGALGCVLWWFWLIRLGSTAPSRARGPVLSFLVLAPPLAAALFAAGWYFGLRTGLGLLFEVLRLSF